ncbi:Type IV pilus biogenesis protein PilO [hydrothermal vent metagenome]|uniref:Type IV pilus biogenesis protein PilO n=1 Tax=hydrothermal vent metagenome TaxID=652676 RepID=A0A3B0ZRL6_9ZZZZ
MKDIDLNNLDLSNLGAWPTAVKVALIIIVSVGAAVAGYFLDVQGQIEKLERVERTEITLKTDFESKQAKAVNLDAYKQQLTEIEESFGAMLRQLPSKTEVEGLLVDISQTGLASGIEFQLFKPQGEQFIEFYAELPIKMVMTGDYHEFGNFVSGVAALPRIVTLHDISIKDDSKAQQLTMEVTAKTYRYLDDTEIKQQKKTKKKGRR